ncbi:MAG: hypothetical protein KJZ84_07105 [Bryobacteraceae bacterium]|nr:hypothetical protein [Bryobacteraceae bacterium]
MLSRRAFPFTAAALAGCAQTREAAPEGWPAAWDAILVSKAVAVEDGRFDEKEQMVVRLLDAGYRYHTLLRNGRAHPTRESLEYALGLLETGDPEREKRAFHVLERVISLQNTDPSSRWYGIWGWYLQEPPEKMAPADWNWADFNGATLLLIERRHGERLSDALRARVREAIRHAAASIMRRNVSMSYTNIAAKGTFVTLAAAELLEDGALLDYAAERIQRLARAIDETGSFAEYNSPTYARVTIANLTRIRMYVRHEAARATAARIERRVWEHLAARWDAPRWQFSGPMSRCYSTNLGDPAWLAKSLVNRILLTGAARDPQRLLPPDLEAGIHDYRCPEDLAPRFLTPELPREHREIFIAGKGEEPPVQGTTWLTREFSIGSVNRGDFWNQRRPLLGYWGGTERPARYLGLRVIKDGYDFSSALFFSVQKQNYVLGLINFRNPGGDRHISLDPIQNGRFRCGRLFAEFDFEGFSSGWRYDFQNEVFTLDSPEVSAWLDVRAGHFGPNELRRKVTSASNSLVYTVDLLPEEGMHDVEWSRIPKAWIAFTLALNPPGATEEFARRCHESPFRMETDGPVVELEWVTPAGRLELHGGIAPAPVEAQTARFKEIIDGQRVPSVRLGGEPLAV